MVRQATAADVPALCAVWVDAWRVTFPAIDFAAREDWIAARLRGFLERGVLVLCVGEAEGFITLDATGEVDQLVVAPGRFGTGAAGALMAAAKARSGRLWLSVNRDNPRARAFYAREGFRAVGEGVNPASGLAVIHLEWKA